MLTVGRRSGERKKMGREKKRIGRSWYERKICRRFWDRKLLCRGGRGARRRWMVGEG